MFDTVWIKVLDRVILDPVSAFGFVVLVEKTLELEDGLPSRIDRVWRIISKFNNSCLLGELEGRVHLLYSHALALLNIIHEDDISRLRLATEKPSGAIEDHQRRLRCLFQHVACIGGNITSAPPFFRRANKATALHLACLTHNRAAVDMMLQSTKSLSDDSINDILFIKNKNHNYPIGIAIGPSRSSDPQSPFKITKMLLEFEKFHCSTTSVSSHLNPAIDHYISKQWSLLCGTRVLSMSYSQPALHLAMKSFKENQMCHLLDVAQPEDINIRDNLGCTALHVAAEKGFLRLAGELVEKYGADIEARDRDGTTPARMAHEYDHQELLEYFKGRGIKDT